MAHTREEQSHATAASERGAHAVERDARGERDARAVELSPPAELPPCPACGAAARRTGARYCGCCGRQLRERDYRPADCLRASYRWPNVTRPAARRTQPRAAAAWRQRNEQTARGYVFLAYSLVPLVGVAFCACAFACCAAGLCEASRARHAAAAGEARRGVVYSVLFAGVQTFIWLVAFYLPWRALS